uniref:NADH-ubiquinone oxidoreductase chain 3 n=1 Tax=Bathymodiolus aduloides TaxID=268473 RepID=A0A8A2F4A6_9BIVA|nr:NADH dehydrogenase subunit 3 [Bathymodiolus aduloides]QSV10324.1 NADH dehydrogenase subunit 3 [Bathymodiolus aduloides]
MSLFLSVFVFWLVASVLMGVCFVLSMKGQWAREKASPYECGFDPMLSARSSFSLRFFLLGVLFLVFDVEVVMVVPILFVLYGGVEAVGVVCLVGFLHVLTIGCLYERRDGSMDWVSEL